MFAIFRVEFSGASLPEKYVGHQWAVQAGRPRTCKRIDHSCGASLSASTVLRVFHREVTEPIS
jgi:hypothetical protein